LTYKLNGNGSHEELGERIRSTISNLSIPSAIGANRTGSNAHARNAADIVGTMWVDQVGGFCSFRPRRKSSAVLQYWPPALS